MRKYFFFLLIVISFFDCFCSVDIFGKDNDSQRKNKSFKDVVKETNRKTIAIKVNLKEEKELQESVDNGHQPWRLEPIPVAQVAVVINVGKPVKYEDCYIKFETNTQSEVVCKGMENYIVNLKRLIKPTPHGIWTAISIEID